MCWTFLVLLSVIGSASAQTLRSLAQSHGVYIGAAIGYEFWNRNANPKYRETMIHEFNLVVPENAMKFDLLEPQPDQFNFVQADSLVAFAERNGMKIRGHNLVWHQQSGWVEKSGLGRTEMLAVLKNHANKVLGHYKGKILEWDVVNEAIDDNGGNLRDTFWRKAIGDDYLDSAFVYAHQADPEALLFYNDYSAEGMDAKSNKVYNLVKGFKDRGIPIHGVGLQCHFLNSSWPSPANLDLNMKRLATLGLRVSLTEVDFRIKIPADSVSLDLQQKSYRTLLGVCLANANCKCFLTWGFTDAYSWIPNFFPGMGAALPFDSQYKTKPAYFGMQEALVTLSINQDGSALHLDLHPRKFFLDKTGANFCFNTGRAHLKASLFNTLGREKMTTVKLP